MPHPSRRKQSDHQRVPAQLTPNLDKHLLGYTAAAAASANSNRSFSAAFAIGAVGLGIASLPAAEAKVVYTPTYHTFGAANKKLPIDFNNDGIADASLSQYGYCVSGSGYVRCFASLNANGLKNQVMLNAQGLASDAVPGKVIGPNDQFGNFAEMAGCFFLNGNGHSSSRQRGSWLNVADRYLGFKFTISGETHYAWARISTTGFKNCAPVGTLTGYAYETVPDKPIDAGVLLNPSPYPLIPEAPKATSGASLGALATGAAGLETWRRQEVEAGVR